MCRRIKNRGPDQELPSYGRGQSLGDQLPVYTRTRTRGQARYRDEYGRDAKALELQETVILTTPPPTSTIMEEEKMQIESKKKRELNLSRRRTQKYSWASY